MTTPRLAFGTPRKLPRPRELVGSVVVLDIAFAAGAGGASFEKTTLPFIEGLGPRLAMWIDHHDHVMHARYSEDSRFVLATKAQHGACPEMVTEELVARAGHIDTVCCHTDFDGLCSAAKAPTTTRARSTRVSVSPVTVPPSSTARCALARATTACAG